MLLMCRPLLYPLIALMAGIIIGDFFALPCYLLLTGVLAILLILLFSIRQKWNIASFLLILCLMAVVGLFNIQRQQDLLHNDQHIIHQDEQGRLAI